MDSSEHKRSQNDAAEEPYVSRKGWTAKRSGKQSGAQTVAEISTIGLLHTCTPNSKLAE